MEFWSHLLLDRLVSSKHSMNALVPHKSQTRHLVKPDFRAAGKPSLPRLCAVDHSQMDPLLARGYHNLRCSRLGRLPEELLLDIVRRLDLLDRIRLRHVSRLFMRLYESHELSVCVGEDFVAGLPWQVPSTYVHKDLRLLTRLLAADMDDYCGGCRHTRRQFRWPWHHDHLTRNLLFCARCRLHHPRHLFSERERNNRDGDGRVCIAHQGAVRLCSHQTVGLADVLPVVRSELQRSLCAGRPLVSRTRLLTCTHPSHQPDHQGCALPLYTPKNTAPTLYVVVNMRTAVVHLLLEWNGHLVLPRDVKADRPVTAEMVQAGVEKLRVGAAEFLFPTLPGGRLPEMTCMDPNRCVCLHRPGCELMPAGWVVSPPRISYGRKKCMFDRTARLWNRQSGSHNYKALPDSKGKATHDKEPWYTTHSLEMYRTGSSLVEGVSRAMVHLSRCESGHPSCVEVAYSSRIEVFPLSADCAGPTLMESFIEFPRPSWIQALDPDSYGATDDRLGFGIAWCPNRECKNYYRCIKKPLMCLKDMYWGGGLSLFKSSVCTRRIYK